MRVRLAEADEPRIVCLMNLATLDDLPEFSTGPRWRNLQARLTAIARAGYEGVQFVEFPDKEAMAMCRHLGLLATASGRINLPGEAHEFAERCHALGISAATLHVGWGMEDDPSALALIDALIESSARFRIPLFAETHRATILQDLWRTVQFAGLRPDLYFNGDFSHWYTGLEMVYGGFEKKLEFIRPVLRRVRFLHGRIGNPGCIQVDIGDGSETSQTYVTHFRQLWTESMRGFLEGAAPGDVLPFAAELLSPRIYYAREFGPPSQRREEGDRWEQSAVLARIARECFAAAKSGDNAQ